MLLIKTFSICTLLASTLAYATPLVGVIRRDDDPPPAELLASCPHGPGSSILEKADRCTLINAATNPDIRVWKPLGNPQLNCGGGSDPVVVTLGGQTNVTQTVEVDANLGFDFGGISIGGGLKTSKSTTTTTSSQVTYKIEPGKQAVYAAGIAMHSMTGTIQVNYGDRQYGHYIWYVFDVTQRVPIDPEDIQFDVYESDCGTDPNDLSSLNTAV